MIYSFAPIINSQTAILILGSMPGVISLDKQEYYGNRRNQFWSLIYAILGNSQVPTNYNDKIEFLEVNKIGLWDVLKQCERHGSLDLNIKNPEVNDFEKLFKEFPAVKYIVFNGKESHRYFTKKYGQIKGITYLVMPSTSPANTMSIANKLEQWITFLSYI
jgi:hypoxanthine-DNA glycosylase